MPDFHFISKISCLSFSNSQLTCSYIYALAFTNFFVVHCRVGLVVSDKQLCCWSRFKQLGLTLEGKRGIENNNNPETQVQNPSLTQTGTWVRFFFFSRTFTLGTKLLHGLLCNHSPAPHGGQASATATGGSLVKQQSTEVSFMASCYSCKIPRGDVDATVDCLGVVRR